MEDAADIIIAGAGLAGLSAALALAHGGRQVRLAGPIDTRPTTRTVALLEGSLRFFGDLGLRGAIEARAAPLHIMRIVDDTGSMFRARPAEFDAAEIGLDAFGWNIANGQLLALLAQAARGHEAIRIEDSLVADYEFGSDNVRVELANGHALQARLVVACDGVNSPAREAAKIPTRRWDYPQTALTAILRHRTPHGNVSTEFHTRQGPCTLVPLPSERGEPQRSSLVWVMHPREARRREGLTPAELSSEIETAAHRLLGPVEIELGPGFVPIAGLQARAMTGPRLALAGEAAHALPPIGAQGLNLGLRDVAQLAVCVERYGHDDPGAPGVLAAYERMRRADVATRSFGVDLMNRALLTQFPPFDALRGLGLTALANIRPLRRLAMREGLAPGFAARPSS